MNQIWYKVQYSLLILLLFIAISGHAQRGQGRPDNAMPIGKIMGIALDGSTQEPIEFATISLFSLQDSSLVTGTISDEKGIFVMEELKKGHFYLMADFIGYEKQTIADIRIHPKEREVNLGKIILTVASTTLAEVEVQANRGVMQNTLDKKIFNVAQNITSKGDDGLQILNNVPSVEVDVDGNISLRGDENVTILIDGRPSSFTASELLQQIPGSQIEQIEVITNPSAKYDPDGVSGIINVVLKKNNKAGINGNITANYGRGKYDRYSGGLGFNIRKNKWNTFLNYSYLNNKRGRDSNLKNIVPFEGDNYFHQDSETDGAQTNIAHTVKLGMDYFVNKKNTLYWSGTYRDTDGDNFKEANYTNYDINEAITSVQQRLTDGTSPGNGYDLNAGWQKKFSKPKQSFDLDFNYSFADKDRKDDYQHLDLSDEDAVVLENFSELREHSTFTATADYVHPIEKNTKIETGLKSIIRTIDTDVIGENFIDSLQQYENDVSTTNQFIYDQQTYSAYFIFAHQFQAFSLQAGLRAEQTFTDANLVTTDVIFENDYFSLFPSVHLSKKINETQEMQLSYSRRINRPNTRRLNPFADRSDPFNQRVGNPTLQPEYIDALELGYSKYWDKFNINTTIWYRHTTDLMRRFLNIHDDGTTTLTFLNFSDANAIGYELIASVTVLKNWQLNTTFNTFVVEISDETLKKDTTGNASIHAVNTSGEFNTRTTRSVLQFSSTYSWKDWNFQMSGKYRHKFHVFQGEISSFFNLDAAISKTILKGNGTLALRASDILGTLRFKYETDDLQYHTRNGKFEWDARVVNLNFSYRFGKQVSGRQKKQSRRIKKRGLEGEG